jgi:5,10-methylenetetrahydrofolate reductase
MSKLSENFGKKFIVTGEAAPPKGPDTTPFLKEIEELKPLWPKLYGVNVVDIPGSILLMSSLGASIILKQHGLEPVYQMVCRDRNMLALQADLLSAAAFGIENVLSLAGDHPACKSSDHPRAKPVYDLDSTSLIVTIKKMNEGFDLAGNKLNAKTKFFVGGAVAPGVKPIEPEMFKMRRKLLAGADFIQTQAVFEAKLVEDYLAKYEKTVGVDDRKKVCMSLVPLYSYGMVKFLRTMPGVVISEETGQRIKKAKDPLEEGVAICVELVDKAKELGVAGIHLMPAGKITALVKILENI